MLADEAMHGDMKGNSMSIPFDEALRTALENAYATADIVAARGQVVDCLRPTQGARILDIGSDPGFLVNDIARLVGSPGGVHGVILDSDWAAPYWSATDTVLPDRIIAAWSEHCAQQEVPMRLAAYIRRAGLSLERVVALPLVNVAYDPDCFSYWGARIIEAFVTGRNGLTAAAVKRWLAGLDSLQRRALLLLPQPLPVRDQQGLNSGRLQAVGRHCCGRVVEPAVAGFLANRRRPGQRRSMRERAAVRPVAEQFVELLRVQITRS